MNPDSLRQALARRASACAKPSEGALSGASAGFTWFDTALGRCALAWSPSGIAGVQLPEETDTATLMRLLAYTGPLTPASPPPKIRAAIAQITALLAGEPHDLSALVLDFSRLTPFRQRVYAVTRAIPCGQTRTYGDIAAALGNRQGARAVGQALGFNPFAPVVPCHRVLAAGGRPGGFSAHGGACTKLRMLAAEGVQRADDGQLRLYPADPA